MGIDVGPIEVVDGLVFQIDSANSKSFSGSGNTIYDISSIPNNYFANFLNGYTSYGSSAGLGLSFTGVNAYLVNQQNLYSRFPTSSVSMFIWAYSVGAGNIISEIASTTPNSTWYDSNIEINVSGNVSMSVWHNSLTNKVVSSALNFNTWYYLGWTYDGSTFTGYINGASIGTTTLTRVMNSSAVYYTLGSIINTNMGTGAYWKGMFSNFSVYNRSLTASEVFQNYSATKGRYR